MSEREWMPFVDPYARHGDWPRRYEFIQIRKGLDGEVSTVRPEGMHPQMNVYDWYWRPCPAHVLQPATLTVH